MNPNLKEKIEVLYEVYNNEVKPLLALVEATYEAFPVQVLNEIRAFNDHLSRCYVSSLDSESIDHEMDKAKSHLKRIRFDCFKFLNVFLHDKVSRFEKQTRNTNLSVISNGDFFIQFNKLNKGAILAVRDAKRLEHTNSDRAFEKFEEAYNLYTDLENLIDEHRHLINWARLKHPLGTVLKIVLFFITAIISGFISNLLGLFDYDNLLKWLKSFF